MACVEPSVPNEFLVRPIAAWSLEVEKYKTWLEREHKPDSFYELLGVPHFTDDRDVLLSEVRTATKYFHQHQNHKNPELVRRARSLQLLCASASHTFSDDDKWRAYDLELMGRLRDELLALTPRPDVRAWIREHGHVAEHRIENVVRFISAHSAGSPDFTASESCYRYGTGQTRCRACVSQRSGCACSNEPGFEERPLRHGPRVAGFAICLCK